MGQHQRGKQDVSGEWLGGQDCDGHVSDESEGREEQRGDIPG